MLRARLGGVGILRAEHAGEFEQVGELDLHRGEVAEQFTSHFGETGHGRWIDPQRFPAFRRAQAHAEVELAARHAPGNPFTQRGFQRAQLVRQAGADFEETVVHRAQFARQRAPGRGAFAGGEGGHAADHGDSRGRLEGGW